MPAHYSLQKFKSQVLGKGLAKPNRFEVFIPPPQGLQSGRAGGDIVSLLCEQASFPMLTINTKPFKIYGPSYQRPTGIEYGGEGLPFTFHVDREMKVKTFFDEWMQLIVNKDTFNVTYQREYITDITIKQLDEADNVTYTAVLKDSFPRNLNLMDLNHSAQSQTHRLTVLFAYRKWTTVSGSLTGGTGTSSLFAGPRSVTFV